MKIYSIFLILLLSQMLNVKAQTYYPLSGGNFTEDWTNIGSITVNDDWSAFASIKGFLGDDGTTTANPRDPQLQLVDYLTMDVIANITNPNTNSSGGVGACVLTNPVAALQGSGASDNPFLMIYLNTTGVTGIQVQYNLRDVDGSADNSVQPVAFQYRVGTTGNFTNIASAFVADASSGPSLATLETPVSLTLPVECENQSQVQIRIMTGNAVGSDEWIGIDDIIVSGTTSSTNTVTFTVTDNAAAPIAGATITINGQTLTTDTLGIASINLPDAAYPYTITAAGFNDTTGNAVVAGTALAVNVTMTTTPTYTVTFTVSDNTPAPIAGATISINGQTLTSDTLGIASINLPDAAYPYTITAAGFNDTTGNAVVAGTALAVNVTMTTAVLPSGQIIISQYIETSAGSTPKGIELWNKSGVDIDFSISNLVINQGTNGALPANEITINTGTLLNNAVLVIGTDADVSGTGTGFRTFVESNGATFVTYNFTFNGDDALEVWLDGVLQDVFGTVGIDPGTSWSGNGVSTSNQNISLINGIITGDTDGWSDPSLRFDTVTIDNSLTGFGIAPIILTPSKLIITDVNGGSDPVINFPFNVTVELRDSSNLTVSATSDITVNISLGTGTGILSGTLSGIIATGNSSVTFSDIQYNLVETGVSIIVADNALILESDTSSLFNVLDTANHLQLVNVPATGNTAVNLASFTVEALRADNSVDVNFTENITLSKASGTGNISGTITAPAIAGVATFSDIQFDAADTYTISASSGTLTAAVSGNIIITDTIAMATQLAFVGIPASGTTSVNLNSFTVEARKADNSVDTAYTNDITLAVVSGMGNISGTITTAAVAGIATFNDIQFNAADTFTISASSGTLTIATSGNIVISDPVTAAILPTSYDWTPSTNYPQGWTNNGLTFYTTGNLAPNSGKFDIQDDNIIVFYDTSACIVEYYLKGNGLTIPYQLDLTESTDGNTYSVLMTHSDTQNSLTSAYQYFTVSPALTSRYIKFNYTVKTAGNIAIDDVLIDLCTGINTISNNKSEITIYPNPAKQVLYVTNINRNSTISIMNILGETVYTSTNLKQNNLSISLEGILTGLYIFISADANGNKNPIRFVKE